MTEHATHEIWKRIPWLWGLYQVSSFGRVRSLDQTIMDKNGRTYFKKGRIRKPVPDTHGYFRIALRDGDRKKKNFAVHFLVSDAFLGPRPGPTFIDLDHRDRNNQNNRAGNLRWATRAINNYNGSNKPRGNNIFRGVYFNDRYRKPWVARLGALDLARFTNAKDAIACRRRAVSKYVS